MDDTMQKIAAAIATMTDEEKAALLGALGAKQTGDTYKVRELVEISFAEKPSKAVREELSAAGFHWNSFEKVWFAYKSDEVMAFVEKHGIKAA